MKIICVGKNYLPFVEKGQSRTEECLPPIFLKNDSSILAKNIPFFIPDFLPKVIKMLLKITQKGFLLSKNI